MFVEPLTDTELVQCVAKYDRRALDELYMRHARTAMSLAFRMLGERSRADEIVQESFWRVWQHAASFEVKHGQFATWLFAIVRHLALHQLERRAHAETLLPAAMEEWHAESAGSEFEFAAIAFANVTQVQMRAAFDEMPDVSRSVIAAMYFEGMPDCEIAAQRQVARDLIHVHASAGLYHLRKTLLPLTVEQV